MPEGWDSVFLVQRITPRSVHVGRGGVQCPGAESVGADDAHGKKGRVQSPWYRGWGSHVLCTWEGEESSSSGVEEGEWVGSSFPGAEDLETVQGLCRIV